MRAAIVRMTGGADDARTLARAGEVIRSGGLVAFPTETVYGLGAHALDERAVGRIFEAKGRPASDPVIVHVADAAQLDALVMEIPDAARPLMKAFWPGPLTLIFRKAAAVPARVTAGGPTVAVRVPAHPMALALLRAAGVPIAAPSANRFSRPSPTTAADVAEDLGDVLDLIIDGGSTTHGVESTVVDATTVPPRVLRPGAVTLEALQAVDPSIALRATVTRETTAAQVSPGTLLKHYSPRAEVRLWTGAPEATLSALRVDVVALVAAGRRVGVLLVDEDLRAVSDLLVERVSLGAAAHLEQAAARLFAALRELDRSQVDVIVTRDLGREGLGLAIWDRLFRAAEGRVLQSR